MSNSYKSANFKRINKFLNSIYKTKKIVYYKNDGAVCESFNSIDHNKRQQLSENPKKNRTKKKHLHIRKNTKKCCENKINVNAENVDNNVCSCLNNNVANSNDKLHLKINVKINNVLFSKENFSNKQFVIIIFLLALLITVNYTEGNETEQQTANRRRPYLLADVSSMPDKNLTISIPCYHYTFSTINVGPNSTIETKSRICHNLRYIYQRHRNNGRFFHHIKSPISYKFNRFKIPSRWLNNYISFKISGNKNNIQKKDEFVHQEMQYRNVSNVINKQIQKIDFNTNAINFENYLINDVDDSNRTNINKKIIQPWAMNRNINNINKTNQSYNNNNIVVNNTLIRNLIRRSESNKYTNYTTIDNVKYNDNVVTNVSYTTILNLLQNINPSSKLSSNDNESFEHEDYGNNLLQKQEIDTSIIMKLVMDGLGIKKAPNMQRANISQHEYVTKYREYLRRLHIRKRRRLLDNNEEYDENTLRPLDILSIPSTEISIIRRKRYANFDANSHISRESHSNEEINDYHDDDEGDQKESLMERVKNILLFKKKYQKPRSTKKEKYERRTNIRLMFALKPEILNLSSVDIEDANVRMVLIHSPILAIRNTKYKRTNIKSKNNSCISNEKKSKKYPQVNALNLKLYFISKSGKKILLDGRKLDINVDLTKPDETHTQWLQFDVSKAVKIVVDEKQLQHVTLELQCDNCKRFGARILNDAYDTAADALTEDSSNQNNQLMPILNIIGRLDKSHRTLKPHKYDNHQHNGDSNTQQHYHHNYENNKNRHKNRRTNCYKTNQRCCRHPMEVTFKEIKGFEFIIQPKVFDAGYCHGRCPPRYNPANHHAMLQSLIWKQNHKKAPKPCCAPSKLIELEVLHVDEKDSEKLKISTWSDMKVVECACS